jgi:hypothetical protein
MANNAVVYTALFGIVAAPFAGASAAYQLLTQETERFTPISAETVYKGSGESASKEKRIQVITENGCTETYVVEDSLWNWQWYSSNLHAVFAEAAEADPEDRKVFEATHYGWRVGLFSWMENVVEAEEVEGATPFVLNASNPACKL